MATTWDLPSAFWCAVGDPHLAQPWLTRNYRGCLGTPHGTAVVAVGFQRQRLTVANWKARLIYKRLLWKIPAYTGTGAATARTSQKGARQDCYIFRAQQSAGSNRPTETRGRVLQRAPYLALKPLLSGRENLGDSHQYAAEHDVSDYQLKQNGFLERRHFATNLLNG